MKLGCSPSGHASGQVIHARLARHGGGNAPGIEHVAVQEVDAESIGLPQRGRPPVHRRHLLAAIQQRANKMEADEPARAGDQDLRHARKLPFPKAAFPISLTATPAECYRGAPVCRNVRPPVAAIDSPSAPRASKMSGDEKILVTGATGFMGVGSSRH